jgi:hydroxymethylpyrimidine kinase/phosphomethylpyrimidine kinase/thiamine-phosphate diphosphorylase
MAKPTLLLIGGVDPQGCAGLSVDIQTATHHDCHATVLVTALTEQNSNGLRELGPVDVQTLKKQFLAICDDVDIHAIKIGLIPNVAIASAIVEMLTLLPKVPVVLDPVLAASAGGKQVDATLLAYMRSHLIPRATLVTPNLPELVQLVPEKASIEQAAHQLIADTKACCLVKGGHQESAYAIDFFLGENSQFYCYHDKVDGQSVRGTGCVLATSLACHLAMAHDIRDAVVLAKAYVTRGIRLSSTIGPYQTIHHSHDAMILEDIPKLCYERQLIGQSFHFPACPHRLGIYPVVDTAEWVQKLVPLGIETIQLRIKNSVDAKIVSEIETAVHFLENKSVSFFVNDYWSQAIAAGAYGVHLGQEDLHDANLEQIAQAGLRLGVSTHSYWELARALAVQPSYIALGPIFETNSKQMPFSPQGEERVKQWVTLLSGQFPLVAIGGIEQQRAVQLKSTGVGSVAMISAITQAEDYEQATKSLLAIWSNG